MAATQTLARPYARAAFSVAREAGELPAWGAALDKLAAACGDDKLAALIRHPGVADATIVTLLAELAGGPAALKNLLGILAENGKLTLLPAVAAEFEGLKAAFEKMRHVAIASASEVSGDKQAAIVEALKKRLSADVAIDWQVDPELIGGAVVAAGDLVIDGSVRGEIERLRAGLTH